VSLGRSAKFEHAILRVRDVEQSVAFCREVLGLAEVARDGGVVYLGCGLDANYDIGFTEGPGGIEHFAIRVDEEQLEAYAGRLQRNGVQTERRDGTEPTQTAGLRFALPTGHAMELVIPEDRSYQHMARPALDRLDGITPLDCDHVNLAVESPRAVAEWLRDVVGLGLSEHSEPEPGFWPTAFLFARPGSVHHDVGVTKCVNAPEATLHHFAFMLEDFNHFQRLLDRMSPRGVRAEFGPSRHLTGGNLFTYLHEPGGHRYELSSQMSYVETGAPVEVKRTIHEALDAWRDVDLPESFLRGS
jgi:catechol 2,3-dioxygenase